MRRAYLVVLTVYGLWVLFNLYITVFQIGDAGVAGHLGLLFYRHSFVTTFALVAERLVYWRFRGGHSRFGTMASARLACFESQGG